MENSKQNTIQMEDLVIHQKRKQIKVMDMEKKKYMSEKRLFMKELKMIIDDIVKVIVAVAVTVPANLIVDLQMHTKCIKGEKIKCNRDSIAMKKIR